MDKIIVEIPGDYRETIDFLKQVVTGHDGEAVKTDNELVEVLISGFMSMIQHEMWKWEEHEHVHGEHCNHD